MLNKIVNNVEFKMLRKGKECWIKIVPSFRSSNPTSIYIILNGEKYNLDIYDKNGNETHNVFFKGINITPSFYIKSEGNCFRVDCKNNDIKIIRANEEYNIEDYLKNNCSYNSPQTVLWAVNVFYTKTPDKPPFDMM